MFDRVWSQNIYRLERALPWPTNERMKERKTQRTKERKNKRTNEQTKRMKDVTNERTLARTYKRTNARLQARKQTHARKHERTNANTHERTNARTHQRTHEKITLRYTSFNVSKTVRDFGIASKQSHPLYCRRLYAFKRINITRENICWSFRVPHPVCLHS